ncbi:hypothetical protein C8R47DRAFT_1064577 [Mycena vitilis]|nr:hypothetical protein C8R47DRAFT_1064577 [Mycena vitilis]
MGENLFTVLIFFVIFRETREAAIIIPVLTALWARGADRLRGPRSSRPTGNNGSSDSKEDVATRASEFSPVPASDFFSLSRSVQRKPIFQTPYHVYRGLVHIGISLWAKSEELWEGNAKKWRVKLEKEFSGAGMGAVSFGGGVSLGSPAAPIPLPVWSGPSAGVVGISTFCQVSSKPRLNFHHMWIVDAMKFQNFIRRFNLDPDAPITQGSRSYKNAGNRTKAVERGSNFLWGRKYSYKGKIG